MYKFMITFAALGAFLVSFDAQATTINFATALPSGHLGQSVTMAGVTVSGWVVS